MVLNVDLQCSKCYKKVKKILCKFPEIRDQTYDEKANKVTIKVVSCSPEKIRDKLSSKGGGCIKSVEIVKPPPPKPPTPTPPPPKPEDKRVKVSVDLQVQGFCYCKCCSGRPRDPCSCGGQFQCVLCYCKCCSGRPWGPCFCYGRPVCYSWYGYGSGCGETQKDCPIM